MQRKAKSPAELQKLVDAFNENFPVGTRVLLRRDTGPMLTAVRAAAYVLSGHSAVAWFEGVPGCYSIDGWVTPVCRVCHLSKPEIIEAGLGDNACDDCLQIEDALEGAGTFTSAVLKAFGPLAAIVFAVLLLASTAPAQLKRQTPDGEICRDTPEAPWRACAWYERSYLWTREQQEQILRGVIDQRLRDGGFVEIDPNAPHGQILDETKSTPRADVDAHPDWPSAGDVAGALGITRQRVSQRAIELKLEVFFAQRAGRLVRILSPADVQAIADRQTKRGPRLGSKRGRRK